MRIEIGRRNYLLYLLLPHPLKVALLTPASRARLDAINQGWNETIYSGAGAAGYDTIHRYGEDAQHEFPARALVESVWAEEGFGRALELGAGSGYFTTLIARRARSVIAVEPVADLRAVLAERCRREGLANVETVSAPGHALGSVVPDASVDSVLVIQSLHHFHRRPEVFATLGRALRPGGRLYLLEPHHNVRRAARLFRGWLRDYRAPAFWTSERNWATHDFLTRGELRRLCRGAGLEDVRLESYWIPFTRRLVPDPERRFRTERRLGRIPVLRHAAAVLALTARRPA